MAARTAPARASMPSDTSAGPGDGGGGPSKRATPSLAAAAHIMQIPFAGGCDDQTPRNQSKAVLPSCDKDDERARLRQHIGKVLKQLSVAQEDEPKRRRADPIEG